MQWTGGWGSTWIAIPEESSWLHQSFRRCFMSPSGAAHRAYPLLPLLHGAEPAPCPAPWHVCPGQGRDRCPVSLQASPSLRWPHAGRLWLAPAPLPQPPGSACPSPSGRSAMRQQSSGRSRRRGQRSGSSGGPGLGPCTTAPLHTRTVSARLGTGTWDPVALTAVRAAGHLSANPQTQLSPTWRGHAAITLGCAGD